MKHWSWLLPAPLSSDFPLTQSANGCRMWLLDRQSNSTAHKKKVVVSKSLRSLPGHCKIPCSVKPPQLISEVPPGALGTTLWKKKMPPSPVSVTAGPALLPPQVAMSSQGPDVSADRANGTEILIQDQCPHTGKPAGTWGHCCGFSSSHPLLLPLFNSRDSCGAKSCRMEVQSAWLVAFHSFLDFCLWLLFISSVKR